MPKPTAVIMVPATARPVMTHAGQAAQTSLQTLDAKGNAQEDDRRTRAGRR